MIAKDESLFVVLTSFAGVVERKNSFRIRTMVQVKLQEVLVKQKDLDTYLYCTSLMTILFFWS